MVDCIIWVYVFYVVWEWIATVRVKISSTAFFDMICINVVWVVWCKSKNF